MRLHSPTVLAFGLVALYVLTMGALALFVTHPPLLGWLGLGVIALVLIAGALLAVRTFSSLRVSGVRLHPHGEGAHRLLVVLDADVETDVLRSAVELRTVGRNAAVRLVAPIVASSPLHYLSSDEGAEQTEACLRLRAALEALVEIGIPASGQVGPDDPLQAVGDALGEWPADEILYVGPITSRRSWLDSGFELRARDLFGLPVSTVFGKPAAATSAA